MCFSRNQIIRCLPILAFAYCWMTTKANAQFFCVDQLVNSSHAETWNTYLRPKGYISYYHEKIWRLQHKGEDWREFFKAHIPMPESLFARGFFIKRGDYVAIFRNSTFDSIDRISGFWGRSTAANSHMYIELANNDDAWDMSYTRLYVIDSSLVSLEKFHGVELRGGTSFEYDSILSCAVSYLIQHRDSILNIWQYADTLLSFDSLKQKIGHSFDVTIFVADFTGDDLDDFILKTEQKGSGRWRGNGFTFVFESGGILPQFIRWSEFEQIIRTNDAYLLMLTTWMPGTGCWGWTIYEGAGNGTLKHVFSESDYST